MHEKMLKFVEDSLTDNRIYCKTSVTTDYIHQPSTSAVTETAVAGCSGAVTRVPDQEKIVVHSGQEGIDDGIVEYIPYHIRNKKHVTGTQLLETVPDITSIPLDTARGTEAGENEFEVFKFLKSLNFIPENLNIKYFRKRNVIVPLNE